MDSKPLVAIVGRPNVGKSTLFNRLIGSRRAITTDVPGTTRDRIYADAEWNGAEFTVVDTGGLTDDTDQMATAINQQVIDAMAEADLVLFAVDAASGPVSADRQVADVARRTGKPVVLVANKADNPNAADQAKEFYELGFGEPIPVSAVHGRGTGDLCDAIVHEAKSSVSVSQDETNDIPKLAIVGRPNVGKSTLFNKLSGGDRRITGETPGTTRDVGSVTIDTKYGPLELLDTAGLPKAKRTRSGIPKFSLLRTLRAINQADVVAILIDGPEGPTVQDAHIAEYVLEAGKGIVLAVNKWDLVEREEDVQDKFQGLLQERLSWLPSPPVVFFSAMTGEKVDRLARAVFDVYKMRDQKVGTGELNRFVQERLDRLPAGSRKKHPAKLFYLTQVGIQPPTFAVFVNDPESWTATQRRWLAGQLREEFNFLGTPVELNFKRRRPQRSGVTK
jgi:GTP-binding protein